MNLSRTIAVLFMVLGVALGAIAGGVAATEKAFANPCPMHDQGGDPDCCNGGCAEALMGCSTNCSVPVTTAMLSDTALKSMSVEVAGPKFAWSATGYDPFIARPPPPIPIV